MRLTNYLLLTILIVLMATIYGFQYIGNSITSRSEITAKQIREGNSYVR